METGAAAHLAKYLDALIASTLLHAEEIGTRSNLMNHTVRNILARPAGDIVDDGRPLLQNCLEVPD